MNSRIGEVIDDALFKKIVLDCANAVNITEITLTGLGDPLLDPNLKDRIKFIKRYLPNIDVVIYTNGVQATAKKMESLVNAGLTTVYFSLNAADQHFHSQLMGLSGQFDRVTDHIDKAFNIPGLRVYVSVTGAPQLLTHEQVEILRNKYHGKKLFLHGMGNWAGELFPLMFELPEMDDTDCRWFHDNLYFNLKGDLCLCCFDPEGNHSFGNIKETPINELLWGEKRTNFINTLNCGGRGNVKPCNKCTTI
jgi:MoaA/NifB/PqqE/SkfB family radical SAM enzyme